MRLPKSLPIIATVIAIGLIGGLLGANPTGPVAQADSGLPSRATPQPDQDQGHDRSEPAGAHIELVGVEAAGGGWSVVQWQDSHGDWHDVDGWQGDLAGSRRWWVHPRDFGRGPFRWVVQSEPGGSITALSGPFHLPAFPNETRLVSVE